MSKESLARIERSDPEEEAVVERELPEIANDNEVLPHIVHPEAANDNEISQPISTIYSEAPTLAANDNEQIEAVKENLRVHALAFEEEQGPDMALIEQEDVANAETDTTFATGHAEGVKTEGGPNTAQAAGGAEKIEDDANGSGEGPKKPHSDSHGTEKRHGGSGGEKKKGPISKLFGFLLKSVFVIGAALIWAGTTAVRKTTEGFMNGMGMKDGKGGGGSAPKKPSGGGGGGGHH